MSHTDFPCFGKMEDCYNEKCLNCFSYSRCYALLKSAKGLRGRPSKEMTELRRAENEAIRSYQVFRLMPTSYEAYMLHEATNQRYWDLMKKLREG